MGLAISICILVILAFAGAVCGTVCMIAEWFYKTWKNVTVGCAIFLAVIAISFGGAALLDSHSSMLPSGYVPLEENRILTLSDGIGQDSLGYMLAFHSARYVHYRYYIELQNGMMYQHDISNDSTTVIIKYGPVPIEQVAHPLYDDWFAQFLHWGEKIYVLTVPEGTIQTKFELDME
jgi:hypothetical protein